uniref:Uncharacterized protein n=1 Tax=Spongospora subterranea TaxID=70186 RepID=A0A0H5R2A6_9EUKA|eukprot:CRZ02014.1 hypothetical protein [Spongospora subterranea]
MALSSVISRRRQAHVHRLYRRRVNNCDAGRLYLASKGGRQPDIVYPHTRLSSLTTDQIRDTCVNPNQYRIYRGCGLNILARDGQRHGQGIHIGFSTRRKQLGNNGTDRSRARQRIRPAALRLCDEYGLEGVDYIFSLSSPILFMSPKDIACQISSGLHELSGHGLGRLHQPITYSGCWTIPDVVGAMQDPSLDSIPGHYALSLYSGAVWDGSSSSIIRQMDNLCAMSKDDPLIRHALAISTPAQFNANHQLKTYVKSCQRQGHLLRYFIGYGITRGILIHLPAISQILSRIISTARTAPKRHS